MKPQTEIKILKITEYICIVALVISVFFIGFNVDRLINFNNMLSEVDRNSCSNENMFTNVKCLQEELSEFYNYNLSNAGKKLTLEQLKEQGGVCSHYADWYAGKAKEMNYITNEFSFDLNKTKSHKIAVISDSEGYCVADQLKVRCFELE